MSDPDVLEIDLDYLTVEELEEVEDLTGKGIDTLAKEGAPKAKMMRAIGFVMRKRTDPSFTWEQAGKLKVMFKDDVVPPTVAVAS